MVHHEGLHDTRRSAPPRMIEGWDLAESWRQGARTSGVELRLLSVEFPPPNANDAAHGECPIPRLTPNLAGTEPSKKMAMILTGMMTPVLRPPDLVFLLDRGGPWQEPGNPGDSICLDGVARGRATRPRPTQKMAPRLPYFPSLELILEHGIPKKSPNPNPILSSHSHSRGTLHYLIPTTSTYPPIYPTHDPLLIAHAHPTQSALATFQPPCTVTPL